MNLPEIDETIWNILPTGETIPLVKRLYTYHATYKGKRHKFNSTTLENAKSYAYTYFRVGKSKRHMVAVVLA